MLFFSLLPSLTHSLSIPSTACCSTSATNPPIRPQVRFPVHQDAVGRAVRHESFQNLKKNSFRGVGSSDERSTLQSTPQKATATAGNASAMLAFVQNQADRMMRYPKTPTTTTAEGIWNNGRLRESCTRRVLGLGTTGSTSADQPSRSTVGATSSISKPDLGFTEPITIPRSRVVISPGTPPTGHRPGTVSGRKARARDPTRHSSSVQPRLCAHLPDVVAVPPDPRRQLAVAPRPRAALPVAQVALRVEDPPVEQGPDLTAPSFHGPDLFRFVTQKDKLFPFVSEMNFFAFVLRVRGVPRSDVLHAREGWA